jgi:uncharacterized membrane protein YfcA
VIETIVVCLLFGAFAGLLAGLFGIGGGLVLVPFLIWLFTQQGITENIVMIMAVATSLATIIITSISSVLAHHRLGALIWVAVFKLAPGIFTGAVLGAIIADYLPATKFKTIFAFFLLFVSLQMAFQFRPEAGGGLKLNYGFAVIAGSVIGVLSVILGIGGGTLTVPLLVKCRFPMRNAVAISSACGLPIAIAGTLSYAWLGWNQVGLPYGCVGYIYLPAFFAIVATSTIMAPFGAKLANKLPTQQLKRYFSILLFVVAIKLLY